MVMFSITFSETVDISKFLYKYKKKYINVRFWIGVIILYQHWGKLYIYTIYDMQNGKDYFYHYNEFLHNLDFERIF